MSNQAPQAPPGWAINALHDALHDLAKALPERMEELALNRDAAQDLAQTLSRCLEAAMQAAQTAPLPAAQFPDASFGAIMDTLAAAGLIPVHVALACSQLGSLRRLGLDGYTGVDLETLYDGAVQALDVVQQVASALEDR